MDTSLQEVFRRYGILNPDAQFLRHNENRTYCVGGTYLLRIHQPAPGYSTDCLTADISPVVLRQQEMQFLSFLHENAGLPVQTPVKNLQQETVTVLQSGVPATLLTWVTGTALQEGKLTADDCREIGSMVAVLHRASSRYTQLYPEQNTLRYDEALCTRLEQRAVKARQEGCFTPQQTKEICGALAAIGAFLAGTKNDPQMFFRVHADLSPSNLLRSPAGIVPIDFSLSGVSHRAMDIASVFGHISDPVLQKQVLDAYTEESGYALQNAEIAPMLALQVLLFILCQYPRYAKEDWFPQKLNGWCETLFAPLAGGTGTDLPD